jgi:putative restriction endonuclease
MPWIEMSRDPIHGGGDWGFLQCLWSPTANVNGERQGWWERFRSIRAGDEVIHLQGIDDEAVFIGISTCLTDGEETSERPPDPGEWGYAASFFRVRLGNFQRFDGSTNLKELFRTKDRELRGYSRRTSSGRVPTSGDYFM